MAINKLTIEDFLVLAREHPILDVRSPGEFVHAHIPNAIPFPLFTDEERKIVGTAYKQQSKQEAIKLGLTFFGKKMVQLVEMAETLLEAHYTAKKETQHLTENNKTVLVHCWRGGMRSAGIAWLLDLYGFKVYTLMGGYKLYRKWVLHQFEKSYPFQLIGGYTGSGKTEVLISLKQEKEKTINLEGLANHKGSAFGNLGQPKQPSQEMFENLLANQLQQFSAKNLLNPLKQNPIWLEDESQRIGEVNIPTSLFEQMRKAPLFFIQIPFEHRLNYILENYGKFEKEKLLTPILRIKKRLGGLETKLAVNCLLEDDVKGCFSILLQYYDKYYEKSLKNKRPNLTDLIKPIVLSKIDPEENAKILLSTI